jgi:hypothetical protein
VGEEAVTHDEMVAQWKTLAGIAKEARDAAHACDRAALTAELAVLDVEGRHTPRAEWIRCWLAYDIEGCERVKAAEKAAEANQALELLP